MKIFKVHWKMQHYGESMHDAESGEEIRKQAENGELITDFGDPNEFDDQYDVDSGWVIDYIKEVKGGEAGG